MPIDDTYMVEGKSMATKRQQEQAFRKAQQAEQAVQDEFDVPDVLANDEAKADDSQMVVDALKAGEQTDTVDIFGHTITYKALSIREELMAERLAKPMAGTNGYNTALATAYFSQSVQTIDNLPFDVAISDNGDAPARRFSIAMNYYRPFISAWFDKFLSFRESIDKELAKLGK